MIFFPHAPEGSSSTETHLPRPRSHSTRRHSAVEGRILDADGRPAFDEDLAWRRQQDDASDTAAALWRKPLVTGACGRLSLDENLGRALDDCPR